MATAAGLDAGRPKKPNRIGQGAKSQGADPALQAPGQPPKHATSRALALEDVFTSARIRRVWKHVRDTLREHEIADLHDYLDVHRNKELHAHRIRDLVLSGRYRPSAQEITTSERAHGVSRRIPLPSFTDAVVLQVLADALLPVIERRQPTKNAYYSRSKGSPKGAEHVDGTFGYEWWVLWPEFQRRIWEFAKSCPFVVVTDLANYFDSIPHAPLRNTIAALGQVEEPVLDLLFYTLEAFTWRPYYLPASHVGVPQLDLDAPRMLAHAYLFPVDEFLARETGNHVVRWMDDIDFGVSSVAEARRLLGQLDALLHSRGLRLNGAKTRILSGQEAVAHFCMADNQALSFVEERFKSGMLTQEGVERARTFLRRKWEAFRRRRPQGQHEKIRKRFLTLFGSLGDATLVPHVERMLCDSPSLRDGALRYFRALGFSPKRLTILEQFMLRSGACLDDDSICSVASLLVTWRVPPGRYVRRICEMADELPRGRGPSWAAFQAGLWLLAKYGSADRVNRFIAKYQSVWTRSQWAARQVACVLPRLSASQRQRWIDHLVHAGLYDGVGVAAHSRQLQELTALDQQLRTYLLHPVKKPFNFALPKLLVALTLLDGTMPEESREKLRDGLLELVDDPVMRQHLLAPGRARVRPPVSAGIQPLRRSDQNVRSGRRHAT